MLQASQLLVAINEKPSVHYTFSERPKSGFFPIMQLNFYQPKEIQ